MGENDNDKKNNNENIENDVKKDVNKLNKNRALLYRIIMIFCCAVIIITAIILYYMYNHTYNTYEGDFQEFWVGTETTVLNKSSEYEIIDNYDDYIKYIEKIKKVSITNCDDIEIKYDEEFFNNNSLVITTYTGWEFEVINVTEKNSNVKIQIYSEIYGYEMLRVVYFIPVSKEVTTAEITILYDSIDLTIRNGCISIIVVSLIIIFLASLIKNRRKINKKFIVIFIICLILILLVIKMFNNDTETVSLDKPIIYLYPEEETEVSVKLDYPESITVSYPKYETGWNVLAKTDGILIDLNTNRQLYSLYYESNANIKFEVTSEGFIVKGEDVSEFLEEKLEILGLNERESEEFIIYWLPVLQENEYNYIRFATTEEIEENMPLTINPSPDTVIRVLMTYKGLNEPIEVEEQELETPERTGFVAVEWGGTEIK